VTGEWLATRVPSTDVVYDRSNLCNFYADRQANNLTALTTGVMTRSYLEELAQCSPA